MLKSGGLHLLNARIVENGICLGHMEVDTKTNEITVIPNETQDMHDRQRHDDQDDEVIYISLFLRRLIVIMHILPLAILYILFSCIC